MAGAMSEQSVITILGHLCQVDIDAISAYTQAIDHCGDPSLTRVLVAFRGDHERHVRDVSEAMRGMGAEPPERVDIAGFGIANFTAIAANAGLIGALTAMESNEIVTNDAYRQALARDLPDHPRRLVERNYRDEQRHLETIRARLADAAPAGAGRLLDQTAAAQGTVTSILVNNLRWAMPALMLGAGAAWLAGSRRGRREGARHTPPTP